MRSECIDIVQAGLEEHTRRQLVLEGYCVLTTDKTRRDRLSERIPPDMVYYCPPWEKNGLIDVLTLKGYRVLDLDEKKVYTPTLSRGNRVTPEPRTVTEEDIPRELEYWLEYWWVPQELFNTIISIRRELDDPEFYMIVEGTRDKKALMAIFGREYGNKIIVLNGGGKNLNPLEIEEKLDPILSNGREVRIAIWTDLDSHGKRLEKQLVDYLAGRATIVFGEEKRELLGYAKRPCIEQLSSFVEACKNRYTI